MPTIAQRTISKATIEFAANVTAALPYRLQQIQVLCGHGPVNTTSATCGRAGGDQSLVALWWSQRSADCFDRVNSF